MKPFMLAISLLLLPLTLAKPPHHPPTTPAPTACPTVTATARAENCPACPPNILCIVDETRTVPCGCPSAPVPTITRNKGCRGCPVGCSTSTLFETATAC